MRSKNFTLAELLALKKKRFAMTRSMLGIPDQMMANMPVFQGIILQRCIAKHLRCGKPTARKAELEKALRMSMMQFDGHRSKLFWWMLQPLQSQLGPGPTSQEKP